jgi:hypothetical protein
MARMASPNQQAIVAATSELELNRLLEAEPQSVLRNIRKADYRLQAGDGDLACYFYRRALHFAGERPLPQDEAAEVRRAELALADVAGRTRTLREARLTEQEKHELLLLFSD